MVKRTKKEWNELREQYKASGLTAKEWCQKEQINYNTLRNGLQKMRTEERAKRFDNPVIVEQISSVNENTEKISNTTVHFMELQPKNQGTQEEPISIQVGKAKIEVQSCFDANMLTKLLKVVCEVC